MTGKTRLAVGVLATALLLGLLGDGLLRAVPWGLNVGMWFIVLVIAIVLLARWAGVPLVGGGRWLLLPAIGFAFAFAWRDSAALGVANLVALLGCVALVVSYSRKGRIAAAGLAEYLLAGVWLPLVAPVGVFATASRDVEWTKLPRGSWARHAASIGTGLAIAIPLLLIFGALFASADVVFSAMVGNLFRWNLADLIAHVFWVGFWACAAGGVVRETLHRRDPEVWSYVGRLPRFSLGTIEVATVLGLLDALFLVFVLVQLRYLFGGAALVEASVQLTYAEYARRGFFELVVVVALTLPILLAADRFLRRERPADERLFRALAGLLVLLLFVVMASSLQRMSLYQEQFGLTELRLYSTAFMLWLAVLLIWFVATVLLGRRHRFAFGMLVTGLILVATLDLLSPDALIASTNVMRTQSGLRFDASYITKLSGDAIPEIVRGLPNLPEPNRRVVAREILPRWSENPSADIRSWNWGRSTASEAVRANRDLLEQMAGSAR